MSFIGHLNIELTLSSNRITHAAVIPSKEVHIEKILVGKTPADARQLVPTLFALCPDSQYAAANLALHCAQHGEISKPMVHRMAWLNRLERINEGIRFFILEIAPEAYRHQVIKELQRQRELVRLLKETPSTREEEIKALETELCQVGKHILLSGFSDDWEQDIYNGMFPDDHTGISSAFFVLSDHRNIGWSKAPLLKKSNQVLLTDIKDHGNLFSEQILADIPYITGSISRHWKHPLVSALLQQDGDTTYTRLTARLVDTIKALEGDENIDEMIAVTELKPSEAACLVQNARGVLIHAVKIGKNLETFNDRIDNYFIMTPTEINVVDSPEFINSLTGLQADSKEELLALARLLVLSYDPCTQIHFEVKDA